MAVRRARVLSVLTLAIAAAFGLWLAFGPSRSAPETAPHVERPSPKSERPEGDESLQPALTGREPGAAVPDEKGAKGVGLSLLAKYAPSRGSAMKLSFILTRDGFRKRYATETGVVWSSVPAAGRYEISEVEADGTRYVASPPHVDVDGKEQLEIVLELPGRIELRVRAADTQAPVAFPRAVRVREYEHEAAHFPWRRAPAPDPVTGDAHGNLSLPEPQSGWRWFVMAEGFAWRRVEVVPSAEPVTLMLERGGTLALRISGWQGLTDAKLVLWPAVGEALEVRPPDADGVLELEGLPVGAYVLRAQRGHWILRGPPYAEARFEISAAQRTSLAVTAADPDTGRQSPVRGDLLVAPGWATPPEVIELIGDSPGNQGIEHIVALRADPLRPGRFTFESKPVPWGSYLVLVNWSHWYQRIRLSADATPIELRLGPPARVLVQIHTAKDGSTPAGAEVLWRWSRKEERADDEGWGDTGMLGVPFDLATKAFTFQAASGTVTVSGRAPGYVGETAEIEVGAGAERKHVFALLPAAKLVVHVLEEGKPSTAEVIVWMSDEDGKTGRVTKTGKLTMDDLEPGESTVEVEVTTPGYDEVPPRTLRLIGGETTEVVVDLKRTSAR